ncbi:MAG: DTW domain-containing protein [Deltaproteobacteria bacterium]|nr:DTW domain-containing protein [Deltaproteobacteria bacterium]
MPTLTPYLRSAAPGTFSGRPTCPVCSRPTRVCYCSRVQRLDTRTHVLILQHPRERKVGINTARIASLCLPNSEFCRGVDFSADPIVQRALHDPARPAALLFPGDDAIDVRAHPPQGDVTLVVLDGTWWQAAKLLKSNRSLQELPRYGLTPGHPSRYRIRKQPAENCVATIEALAEVLGVIEGDPERMDKLLIPFDAMVQMQLELTRTTPTPRHCKPAQRKPKPPVVPTLLRDRPESVVLAGGEVNEWPRDKQGPRPQVVHWVAVRPHTGDRFEAVLRPLPAMAPSCDHIGLSREEIESGESQESFAARWRAFLRADDVLCMWGRYAGDVLAKQGVELPSRLDLRLVTIRHLGARAGAIAACAKVLGVEVGQPWARGRAGIRAAALEAIAGGLAKIVDEAEGK